MNPNLHKHLYAIAAIIAIALIGAAYLNSRTNVDKADQVKADVAKQIADLRSDLKDTLAAIRADRENVKTPAQVAYTVPKYTPDVRPIVIVPNGVPTVPSQAPAMQLVDAPSQLKVGSLVIPAEQVPAYWKSVTDCAEDKANLGMCQKQVPLLEQRAQAAEKAMKGGGFWRRVKANGKWFVIGGLTGAAAFAASHH